jgi:hypothetical protein
MRLEMPARQRERALAETMADIERREVTPTGRAAWISVLCVLLLAGATAVHLAEAAGRGTRNPVSPATGPAARPAPPLPSGVVVQPSSLPTPSFSVPLPTPGFSP